jgi:small subunit ribosomal protein S21
MDPKAGLPVVFSNGILSNPALRGPECSESKLLGISFKGGIMGLRMRVHEKEPIGMALRRFKKLIERSGMQKELRSHQHYEKPSELRRRARLRKEKAARKARFQPA